MDNGVLGINFFNQRGLRKFFKLKFFLDREIEKIYSGANHNLVITSNI